MSNANVKTIYHIRCRTCHIKYESEHPAIVGQPCPNPTCPHGHPPVIRVWWEHNIVKGAVVAGGLTTAGILAFNVGGWGVFVLDLAVAFFFQAVIALILFGVLLAFFLIALKDLFKPFLSNRQILISILLIALVFALPIVSLVQHRPIDTIDIVQTIVLGIVANLLTRPLERFLNTRG